MANVTTVKLNLAGLNMMRRQLGKNGMNNAEIRGLTKRAGIRYLSAMSRRYTIQSRGGGEWEELSESTKARRRGGSSTILIDTGLMVQALEPGNPGNVADFDDRGFTVGFSKGMTHSGSTMTYAELCRIHSLGMGNVPARPILIMPDERFRKTLETDASAVVNRIIDDAARVTGVNRGKRPPYPGVGGFSRTGGPKRPDTPAYRGGGSFGGGKITRFNAAGQKTVQRFGTLAKASRATIGAGKVGFRGAKLAARGLGAAARVSAASRGIAPAAALIAGLGVVALVNSGKGRRRGPGA